MGRTHPYTSIHRKQPTASLVSTKVLSSIIGQIILTSAFQFWAFFWARAQPWCVKYGTFGCEFLTIFTLHSGIHRRLRTPVLMNLKLTTMRIQSCSSYRRSSTFLLLQCSALGLLTGNRCGLIVSLPFTIVPISHSPSFTGVLMFSIITLTIFSVLVLIAPPEPLARLLDIMTIPIMARFTILLAAAVNALFCGALEHWSLLALVVSYISNYVGGRRKRSVRDGKLYSAVEGGMQW